MRSLVDLLIVGEDIADLPLDEGEFISVPG